jgi:hypothetical protein
MPRGQSVSGSIHGATMSSLGSSTLSSALTTRFGVLASTRKSATTSLDQRILRLYIGRAALALVCDDPRT